MWSDEARQASIEARRAKAQANGVAHQNGIGSVGRQSVSDKVLDVIRKSPGAFSVTPQGGVPTKGYMVSVPGRTQEVRASDLSGPGAKGILEGYATKNADVLRAPNAHIGGWTDSQTGRTHLDVSHNISRAREAVKTGRERNQIAIWDVKHKREIRTGGKGDI